MEKLVCGVPKKVLAALTAIVMVLDLTSSAKAAGDPFAACLGEFWNETPPVLTVQGPLFALCAGHFATLYSGCTETPLYSAEHLTAQQIEAAIHMPRHDDFHEDSRLPYSAASTLEDYRGSGFDRGHMAPSGDEPDTNSQYESFALSNMIPQDADDNRYLWADIETAVRELVLAHGDDVYVVTGPLFDFPNVETIRGVVEIPAFIYKAIYDPAAGVAGVYVARNAPGRDFWHLSLAEFRLRSGLDPFPGVMGSLATETTDLPDPAHMRHTRSRD